MVFPRVGDRSGYSAKKCCCDDSRVCYKLLECEESTTCPSDGVYITQPAWDYIETVMQYLPPDGFPVVLQWAEGCCVYATENIDNPNNTYLLSDVLAMSNSGIIWSLTEPAGQGKFIQLMNKIADCEECYVDPDGACCVTAGRGTNCFINTQSECDDLSGKWFGAGSVCTGDDAVDCDDPDPSCGEKRGICFCRELGGVWSGTPCNDSEDTCSSTYSATLSLPSTFLHGMGSQCPTDPFPDECVVTHPEYCNCDDGVYCYGAYVPAKTVTTTLSSGQFGTSGYISPDETGGYPVNERPEGHYAFGGSMGDLTPQRCISCYDNNGYCDTTHKIKTWWFNMTVMEQVIFTPDIWCEMCQDTLQPSDPDYLFCCPEPPCSVWRINISLQVMLENIEDPSLDWVQRPMLWYGYSAYIRTSGCSCPAGLVTSNVHWNNTDDSVIAPHGNAPWIGHGGGRYAKKCMPAGCDHWTNYGYWMHNAIDFIRGITWSIT